MGRYSNRFVLKKALGQKKSDGGLSATALNLIFNGLPPHILVDSIKKYLCSLEKNQENETKNIGQLRIFTGFFSKAFMGSLFTVSSSKPSSIFITAEDEGNAESPGEVILTTR